MRVLLIANSGKAEVSEAWDKAAGWLRGQGIACDQMTSEHMLMGHPILLTNQNRITDYDLVCCFGGDGTILRVARLVGVSGVPMLGFNFGTVGFLTGAKESDLLPALQAALDKKTVVDARTLAEVEVEYADGSRECQVALNEVAVTRGNFGRIVDIDIFINQKLIEQVRGDGVLVATATGSTAYSLSAGGPLITPHFSGLTVVPISPHTLMARSVVTAPGEEIAIYPDLEHIPQIVLFLDGELMPCPADPGIVSVRVRPSRGRLNLLRFGEYDFYQQISRVFFRGEND